MFKFFNVGSSIDFFVQIEFEVEIHMWTLVANVYATVYQKTRISHSIYSIGGTCGKVGARICYAQYFKFIIPSRYDESTCTCNDIMSAANTADEVSLHFCSYFILSMSNLEP